MKQSRHLLFMLGIAVIFLAVVTLKNREKQSLDGPPDTAQNVATAVLQAPAQPPVADEAPAETSPPEKVVSSPFENTYRLTLKVLRTPEETVEMQRMLASPVILTQIRDSLLAAKGGEEAMNERMEGIAILDSALDWKENPSRPAILKMVSKLLDRPIQDLPTSSTTREAVAGDIVELFSVLYTHEPDMGKSALDHASPEQRKLFAYGKQIAESGKNLIVNGGN